MLKVGSDSYALQTRIRQAARRAPVVYPGAVGELLRVELDAYADLSFLWCQAQAGRRMMAVVEDVLGREVS